MGNKKSRRNRNPKPRKKATSDSSLTTTDKKLMWEVSKIDDNGPWGWNRINCPDFLRTIWKKMRYFETMTWNQILGPQHHRIAVNNLIRPAQRRLQQLEHDDVDELVSFRLTGRARLWAIQSEHVSYLLWWDPNHEICPSYKRHT